MKGATAHRSRSGPSRNPLKNEELGSKTITAPKLNGLLGGNFSQAESITESYGRLTAIV